MKLQIQKKFLGFTLIELLVVITIIGILATGATTVYTSQIQKARDTTRINDVKALQSGIEQFYQDKAEYPEWNSEWTSSAQISVMTYLPNLAEDPKHNQTCLESRCWYVYRVADDPDTWIEDASYEISTAFENAWNKDSKAWVEQDSWDDDNRLELWLNTNAIDTVSPQNTDFAWLDANDTDNPIVIIKSKVVTK